MPTTPTTPTKAKKLKGKGEAESEIEVDAEKTPDGKTSKKPACALTTPRKRKKLKRKGKAESVVEVDAEKTPTHVKKLQGKPRKRIGKKSQMETSEHERCEVPEPCDGQYAALSAEAGPFSIRSIRFDVQLYDLQGDLYTNQIYIKSNIDFPISFIYSLACPTERS